MENIPVRHINVKDMSAYEYKTDDKPQLRIDWFALGSMIPF